MLCVDLVTACLPFDLATVLGEPSHGVDAVDVLIVTRSPRRRSMHRMRLSGDDWSLIAAAKEAVRKHWLVRPGGSEAVAA